MLETKAKITFKAVEICLHFYDDLFLIFLGSLLLDRAFSALHMHSVWLSLLLMRLSEDFLLSSA